MRWPWRYSATSHPFAKLRSSESLFDEAKRRLLEDREYLLVRAWCHKFKVLPNDPLVLEMPLHEMEVWLMADRLEAWEIETDEKGNLLGNDLKNVQMRNIRGLKATFDAFFEEVEQEMGADTTFEEVEEEATKRYKRFMGE